MPNQLQKYRDNFIRFIETNDERYVLNSNRDHAHILIEELVKRANESIFIQCTNLSSDVYSQKIIDLLIEKSSEGKDVRIAIRTPERKALVSKIFEGTLISPKFGVNSFDHDYCVIDGVRMRVELDGNKREAIAYAYNKDLGESLNRIFITQVA